MRCFILNWLATPRYLVHHGPLLSHRLGEASHLLSSNECNHCTTCTTMLRIESCWIHSHYWWIIGINGDLTMMNRGTGGKRCILYNFSISHRQAVTPLSFTSVKALQYHQTLQWTIQPKRTSNDTFNKNIRTAKKQLLHETEKSRWTPPSLRAFRSPSIFSNLLHGIF